MYEHSGQPLLPLRSFFQRLVRHGAVALGIFIISLLLGICGYHFLEHLTWLDSFVNAAMILGGMGPVNELYTISGKLFAGFYALYAGLVFLVVAGVIFAPLFHRFLHHFHLEDEQEK